MGIGAIVIVGPQERETMDTTGDETRASSTPDRFEPLDVAALQRSLAGLRLGHPLLYFPTLDSTNTRAVELARGAASEGTLVLTDHQTAGRGRQGRVWEPLPGQQLTLSLVLRPPFAPHWLVMASSLALALAVEVVTGLQAEIKWPNDLLVAGRKVSGILIESSDTFAVLGIGVNVNGSLAAHPALAARATTLAEAAGHPFPREALAAELLRALDARYADLCARGEPAQRELRDAWRACLGTLGRRVSIRQGERTLAGLAEDVSADGALLLRDDAGVRHVVTWGDVE
jgi:BirA family biotin operon repressor/biotin-[acetyl-CoA-carboxylase] ligase